MSRTKRWPTVDERIANLRRSILDLEAEIERLQAEGDPGPYWKAPEYHAVSHLMRKEHTEAARRAAS